MNETVKLLLENLNDDLDASLATLLEPIGESIAASSKRLEAFKSRYNDDAPELAAEIEDFIGVAFVASQTYITTVVSRLQKLHELARLGSIPAQTTTSGHKQDMMRYGSQYTPQKPYAPIEVMNAFANYYKHRDEWDADWTRLGGLQQETATIIGSAGAFQSTTENLRTGAKYLGNTALSNTKAFVDIFASWRKQLVGAYSEAASQGSRRPRSGGGTPRVARLGADPDPQAS
jgi:hypothetical protein